MARGEEETNYGTDDNTISEDLKMWRGREKGTSRPHEKKVSLKYNYVEWLELDNKIIDMHRIYGDECVEREGDIQRLIKMYDGSWKQSFFF